MSMKSQFRMSLSASPYSMDFEQKGLQYTDGKRIANNLKELQELFQSHGGSEIWVRINMRRYVDNNLSEDGNVSKRMVERSS